MCGGCDISFLNSRYVVKRYFRRPIKDHRVRVRVSAITMQSITEAASTPLPQPNQMLLCSASSNAALERDLPYFTLGDSHGRSFQGIECEY